MIAQIGGTGDGGRSGAAEAIHDAWPASPERFHWAWWRSHMPLLLDAYWHAGTLQEASCRRPFQSPGVVAMKPARSGVPSRRHRPWCPKHICRQRATRWQPGTAHACPPNTGSAASKVSTPARNSGRMAAISFSSKPAGLPPGEGAASCTEPLMPIPHRSC